MTKWTYSKIWKSTTPKLYSSKAELYNIARLYFTVYSCSTLYKVLAPNFNDWTKTWIYFRMFTDLCNFLKTILDKNITDKVLRIFLKLLSLSTTRISEKSYLIWTIFEKWSQLAVWIFWRFMDVSWSEVRLPQWKFGDIVGNRIL